MNKSMAILVDLDRCIGCYDCVVGCHQWHQVKDQQRVKLNIWGPEKVGDKMKMYFFPQMTEHCELHNCDPCRDEATPACVSFCPTEALIFADVHKSLSLLNSGSRYQICKVP